MTAGELEARVAAALAAVAADPDVPRLSRQARETFAAVAATCADQGQAWRRAWHGATMAALERAGLLEPVPGDPGYVRLKAGASGR